ncbi:MAG: B-box zinc finger protein [Lentisphaerae bacterium]|nr:B-box zinc finger protein [Lentisphaerota bacterium]
MKCKAPLPPTNFNTATPGPCPACGVPVYAAVFPALYREPEEGEKSTPVVVDDEASCFYHSGKKATIACESCGRFLCALCDIELGEKHLCAGCVDSEKKKGKLENISNSRVLYDEAALALAILPLLMWPSTILTAPATLFVVIRYWKAPGSIVPRSKIKFVFASLFALIEIGGWTAGIVALVT